MRRAVRSKWRIVALFWAGQALLAYLGWPVLAGEWLYGSDVGLWSALTDLGRAYVDLDYLSWMACIVGSVMALQAAFLLPVRRPRIAGGSRAARLVHHGLCGLAVGVMAGLVSLLGLGALEMLDVTTFSGELRAWIVFWPPLLLAWAVAWIWMARKCGERTPLALSMVIAGLVAGMLLGGVVLAGESLWRLVAGGTNEQAWFGLAIMVLLISWAAASLLLIPFARHKPPATVLGRVSSRLLMGTIIEVAALIPLDVMARRKTDCYCAEGSFWALSVCWAAGAVVLGPAIWLLPLSRRRRRWYQGRCVVCGYDMRGCRDAERCPECGTGWRKGKGEPAGV